MVKYLGIIFVLGISFSCLNCYGSIPLTIEDLISDKGVFRLDTSLIYANSKFRGVQAGNPILIQTGETSYTSVPTSFFQSSGDADITVATIGLRYGLTAKAEIYGRTSYLHSSIRSNGLEGINNDTNGQFSSAWLGANYQFSRDNNTPALLGFVEGALSEKRIQNTVSGKSWAFGLTTYRAIDPVVLSLTAGYGWNRESNEGDSAYDPGDFFWAKPSVSFAVNERITLITGVLWTTRKADRLDNIKQGFRQSTTDLTLGFGYGVAKGNSLYFAFKTNGRQGNDLRFNWLYTL